MLSIKATLICVAEGRSVLLTSHLRAYGGIHALHPASPNAPSGFQALEMLVRLCRVSPGVRQWLTENQDRLEWVSDKFRRVSFAHIQSAVVVYRAAWAYSRCAMSFVAIHGLGVE